MAVNIQRREIEQQRLAQLVELNKGELELLEVSRDRSLFVIGLKHIAAPVGITAEKVEIRSQHRASFSLPTAYPMLRPLLRFDQPIFHPNGYTNGAYCIGTEKQWFPARFLHELLAGVVHDIQLIGPFCMGNDSPANQEAWEYYKVAANLQKMRNRLKPVHLKLLLAKAAASPGREQDIRLLEGKAPAAKAGSGRAIRLLDK
jgi:hypothetical protein